MYWSSIFPVGCIDVSSSQHQQRQHLEIIKTTHDFLYIFLAQGNHCSYKTYTKKSTIVIARNKWGKGDQFFCKFSYLERRSLATGILSCAFLIWQIIYPKKRRFSSIKLKPIVTFQLSLQKVMSHDSEWQ